MTLIDLMNQLEPVGAMELVYCLPWENEQGALVTLSYHAALSDLFDFVRQAQAAGVPWMPVMTVPREYGVRPELAQRLRDHAPGLFWNGSLESWEQGVG